MIKIKGYDGYPLGDGAGGVVSGAPHTLAEILDRMEAQSDALAKLCEEVCGGAGLTGGGPKDDSPGDSRVSVAEWRRRQMWALLDRMDSDLSALVAGIQRL